MKRHDLKPTLDFISQLKPGFQPKVAIILGSGLGALAEKIEDKTIIPYSDIPGFPQSTIAGHSGQMVLGKLGHQPVVCMQGRIHLSEGASSESFKIFIRTLKLLGADILLLTNSAGCMREDINPGDLVLINDHIYLQSWNPLMGANDDEFGPRFVDMTTVYDQMLQKHFHRAAKSTNIPLKEGIYICLTGPCFETPAEIRAIKNLGADLVGMSTVPEVILARHCGMRIAAVSSVTNHGAGMHDETLSHEHTLKMSAKASEKLCRLFISVLENLSHDPH